MSRTTGRMADVYTAGLVLALASCGRYGFAERAGDDAASHPLVGCDVPSAGLVTCFPFDGSGADTAHHDDATTTAVSYEIGKVGDAVRLGASTLIKGANVPALRLTTAGTIAAWIRLDALPAAGARSVVVDTNSYGLAVRSTGEVECFYTGTYHVFAADLTAATWTHLACTYDGATVTMWKDGVAIASQPDSGPVQNTVAGLQLGSNIPDANHPNPDRFLGLLDEVGIWSTSLTMADVCAATGSC